MTTYMWCNDIDAVITTYVMQWLRLNETNQIPIIYELVNQTMFLLTSERIE